MIKIGIIGFGHWGPNYFRVFNQLEEVKIVAVCDSDKEKTSKIKQKDIKVYSKVEDMIKFSKIDACVIATPTVTHYSIAKKLLEAGINLLVEKPLSNSIAQAETIVNIAMKKKLKLMVGHTFLFNSGINWLKDYILNGEFGKIFYLYSTRTNLGPIREDVNVLYDLGPHDISIFLHILNRMPLSVTTQGSAYINKKRIDIATMRINFSEGISCFAHISWIEPRKIRQVTAIGSNKMVVFDDINSQETIKIYDKSVEIDKQYSDFGEFKMILRDGDILIPKIKMSEPLKNQCQHFVESLIYKKDLISDGIFGLNVVKILSAAEKSLKQRSKEIAIE